MGKADRNAPDAPVPDFAYTDRHDGRVFVRLLDGDGKYRKKTIGYLTDSAAGAERMIPNRYFRDKYRDLYEESCPDVIVPPRELSMGMYALTLGITAKNGLYDDLVNVYGPVFANVILDYAMFLVWHRQGEAVSFAKNMAGEVLFEDRLRSESWYADFFARKLNEDSHHEFRIKLAQRLKSQGLKKVWLAMTDGGVSEFCHENKTPSGKTAGCREKGGKSCCIYALDASSGQPVTYFVCEDGVPGNKAFQKAAAMMSAFLGSLDAEIEGIILGSGFAKEQVFEIIAEHNWKYVSMLPSDALGHLEMIREYGDAIRWKSAYLICDDAVQDEALFGISGNEKLFAEHERRSAVCLYYDGARGSFRSAKLLERIQAAARKAREAISRNTAVIIPPDLEKYIAIDRDGIDREGIDRKSAEQKVTVRYDELDNSLASLGFFSLAVSQGIDPVRAISIFRMREAAETPYAVLESQDDGTASRGNSSAGRQNRFAPWFISSLIRYEIAKACRKLELDADQMIQSMEQVILTYTAEEKYEAAGNLTSEAKALLGEFGIAEDTLERLAAQFNDRSRPDSKNPVRSLPSGDFPVMRRNSHQVGKHAAPAGKTASDIPDDGSVRDESLPKEKSKGGRPKGKKDSKPRKGRSDKGKIRGSYGKNKNSPLP